jgi:hypothetical protein
LTALRGEISYPEQVIRRCFADTLALGLGSPRYATDDKRNKTEHFLSAIVALLFAATSSIKSMLP